MLLHIRDFIARERLATNQQIARAFGMSIQTLQPMLDIWVRKGVITPCQEPVACQSTCFKCRSNPPLYYRYCDTANNL